MQTNNFTISLIDKGKILRKKTDLSQKCKTSYSTCLRSRNIRTICLFPGIPSSLLGSSTVGKADFPSLHDVGSNDCHNFDFIRKMGFTCMK